MWWHAKLRSPVPGAHQHLSRGCRAVAPAFRPPFSRACCSEPWRRRRPCMKHGGERLRAVGTDASRAAPAEAEVSSTAFQELILFIYQGDCDRELQRALNLERLDAVADIRTRRTSIDEALSQIVAKKQERCTVDVSASFDDADAAAEGVRLRVEMQRAVEEERYAEAAELREKLREAKERTDAALGRRSAQAEAVAPRCFRLGQRVTHAVHGYRGVICGRAAPLAADVKHALLWDEACCEGEEWRMAADVVGAETQPFYHVLVDLADWEMAETLPPVTYVAQDRLTAPAPRTWLAEHGAAALQHPMRDALFLGVDERGDLIPTRALRDKFRQERQDVFPPDDEAPSGSAPSGPD